MKNNKYKVLLLLALIVFTNCDDFLEDEVRDYQEFVGQAHGVLPNYTAGANSVYNLLDPSNSIVDFTVDALVSGGAVVSSGEIRAAINDGAYSEVTQITSFPISLSLTLDEVVNALGLTTANLTGGDIVKFKMYFTDTSGNVSTSSSIHSAAIVCPPKPGVYTIDMQDSYGDGWQGGGVNVILDGETTFVTLLGNVSSGTATFTVPVGATALVLEYVNDSYNEEVSFQITDPDGSIINNSSNPTAGVLTVPSTCP